MPPNLQAQYMGNIEDSRNQFEERSREVKKRLQERAKKRPNSPRVQMAFERAVFETASNRLVMPARPVVEVPWEPRKDYKKVPEVKEIPKAPPKIKDVWKPRARWCDARHVFDTDEVEAKRFEIDWVECCELGLEKLIMKRDDEAGQDNDGDGICDEVEEVQESLWDCHDLLAQVFDYYACSSGSSIGTIGLNQWSEIVEDMALEDDQFCRKADLDTLFISANAASKRLEKANGGAPVPGIKGDEKALNRVEFMFCLVTVAVNRYVVTKKIKDVSEAVYVLIVEQIQPRVDEAILRDYNHFRKQCYDLKVTEVLAKHETSLRSIFGVAAGSGCDSKTAAALLSLDEWTNLLKALDFIGRDVTERDARLCFSCSRMVVIDDRTAKGYQKANNLPFEGFLEALCRLCMLKALPTDDDIEKTGCDDAGIFMQKLLAGSLPEWFTDSLDSDSAGLTEAAAFMHSRAANWGEASVHSLDRAVNHLIACMIRTIEEDSRGADNMEVTSREAKDWGKAHGIGI